MPKRDRTFYLLKWHITGRSWLCSTPHRLVTLLITFLFFFFFSFFFSLFTAWYQANIPGDSFKHEAVASDTVSKMLTFCCAENNVMFIEDTEKSNSWYDFCVVWSRYSLGIGKVWVAPWATYTCYPMSASCKMYSLWNTEQNLGLFSQVRFWTSRLVSHHYACSLSDPINF